MSSEEIGRGWAAIPVRWVPTLHEAGRHFVSHEPLLFGAAQRVLTVWLSAFTRQDSEPSKVLLTSVGLTEMDLPRASLSVGHS